ncbi:MAG: hypothetical protein II036_09135, partial [Oscillospiraceae bacterium]|nr:hypothetical protein [Oscillospiraceae bacterium]
MEDVTFQGNTGTGYIKGGYYAMKLTNFAGWCASGYLPVVSSHAVDGYYDKVYTVEKSEDTVYEAEDDSGNLYTTLDQAIDSAESGSVITLLTVAKLQNYHNVTKPLTVDLADYGVIITSYIELNSGADLTLRGGTWSVQTSSNVFRIYSDAKLKVESGSFSKTNTWSNYLFYLQGGELEITGGTFDWSYNQIIYANGSNYNTLNISGGDFTNTYSSNNSSNRCIIYWDSSSGTQTKSEISGGTFRRGWLNIYNSCLSITGGEFLTEISLNGYSNTPYIKGGLWAYELSSYYVFGGYKAQASSQTISGYSGTVYEIVRDPSATPIAEDDNGNKFYSFLEIASDAVDGSTLTILKNAELSQQWNLANKKLTLDLNGKTVSLTGSGYVTLNSGADITLKGGTWSVQTSSNVFR